MHAALWWLDRNPVPRALWGDEKTYLASAMRLLAGDPSWWPEPLWPPLYPQFIAGLIWTGHSLTAVVVVQVLLLVVSAVLIFDLVRRLTASRPAGVIAACCALGYPPLAAFCHYLWPETLHFFLLVTLIWILVARADRWTWIAGAGLVLGLALLTKSLLLPFVPVILIAAVWGSRPSRAVTTVLLMAGFALATMTPTMVAHSRHSGTPAVGNSAVFNLWVGLNDVGRESFTNDIVWPEYQAWVASSDNPANRDRVLKRRVLDLVRERGIGPVLRNQLAKQYFRLFDAGCYLTDQLPGGAASGRDGSGYVGASPAMGEVVGAVSVGSILLLYVAAPAGLMLGGCRKSRWVRVLVLFVIYNLALFFWLHVKTRYRIQMLPAAFVGVGCLAAWLEAGRIPRPSAGRVVAVVTVVAVLMWLALG
ncbi:MAG: glycosyltransferase family 39 protein [Thermoanaerobaculales bacterium]|nr:glycosyltransferase family 39 protein [Thermoanaerobaculales bacterium]